MIIHGVGSVVDLAVTIEILVLDVAGSEDEAAGLKLLLRRYLIRVDDVDAVLILLTVVDGEEAVGLVSPDLTEDFTLVDTVDIFRLIGVLGDHLLNGRERCSGGKSETILKLVAEVKHYLETGTGELTLIDLRDSLSKGSGQCLSGRVHI